MVERVVLREVGLRDGLQMIAGDLSTERKCEWIDLADAAGVTDLEVTSFVPPKTFPIFADAATVAQFAIGRVGLTISALVLNVRGAADAYRSGLRHVNYVLSASDEHSKANARRSPDEAVAEFERIVALRDELELSDVVTLSCGIATAFGCSIQGAVAEDRVLDLAARVAAAGAAEVMLADTVGYGAPGQVERLFLALHERLPGVRTAAHFHDTRGLGLANVMAALRAGVRRFDASIGGLGGCPYAPGATGNVNFEDTAYLLEAEGYDTGIDFDRLMALRQQVELWLPQEALSGALARAGRQTATSERR